MKASCALLSAHSSWPSNSSLNHLGLSIIFKSFLLLLPLLKLYVSIYKVRYILPVYFAVMNLSNVFKIFPEKTLAGHVINRFRSTSDVECLLRCQRYPGCTSINFVRSSSTDSKKKGKGFCEFNRQGVLTGNLRTKEKSSYYDTI